MVYKNGIWNYAKVIAAYNNTILHYVVKNRNKVLSIKDSGVSKGDARDGDVWIGNIVL